MMDWQSEWVIGWIDRMVANYGGTVYERDGENTRQLDWGQALCRERFGAGWNDVVNKSEQTSSPDDEAVVIAKRWEDGEIPDWVDQECTVRSKP